MFSLDFNLRYLPSGAIRSRQRTVCACSNSFPAISVEFSKLFATLFGVGFIMVIVDDCCGRCRALRLGERGLTRTVISFGLM